MDGDRYEDSGLKMKRRSRCKIISLFSLHCFFSAQLVFIVNILLLLKEFVFFIEVFKGFFLVSVYVLSFNYYNRYLPDTVLTPSPP